MFTPRLSLAAILMLGACTAPGTAPVQGPGEVPEAVALLAAPWQDLSTARLLPEDGCYWYEHDGPVERTLLPLRTAEGRPICTAQEGARAPVQDSAVTPSSAG